MLISWWLAWKYQDAFISDWDGFDYTAYTVLGWPSSLGMGRALFLGYNHLLWKFAHYCFGTPPEEAYLPLRYGVILQSGPAIVGIYALCKELTAKRLAAFFGALLVAAANVAVSARVVFHVKQSREIVESRPPADPAPAALANSFKRLGWIANLGGMFGGAMIVQLEDGTGLPLPARPSEPKGTSNTAIALKMCG